MNNFYASVECLYRPEIRSFPVAVAGDPLNRHGIILAKNMLAKKLGVTTGEAIWEAKLKAPGLVLVQEQIEKTIDMLRYRFGHDAIKRASALLDPKLTGFNPKEDHTIHPYSYFR